MSFCSTKRFLFKSKGLSDAKVVSITIKEHGFTVHVKIFVEIHKALKANIWWMIKCGFFVCLDYS